MSDDMTCTPQQATDDPDDDEPWFCDVTDSENLHQCGFGENNDEGNNSLHVDENVHHGEGLQKNC